MYCLLMVNNWFVGLLKLQSEQPKHCVGLLELQSWETGNHDNHYFCLVLCWYPMLVVASLCKIMFFEIMLLMFYNKGFINDMSCLLLFIQSFSFPTLLISGAVLQANTEVCSYMCLNNNNKISFNYVICEWIITLL